MPFHFFAATDPPLFAGVLGLYTLCVDDPVTGQGGTAFFYAVVGSQPIQAFFPDATFIPFAEMVIDGFPGWEIFRHHPPLNAASQHIEDGVHDGFFGMFMGVSAFAGWLKVFLMRSHSLSVKLLSYDIF